MTWAAGLDMIDFAKLPIDARIRIAAADCLGWRYGSGNRNRFPAWRPMLPGHLVDPQGGYINCSTFTAYILATAFPEADWSHERYKEIQIFDAMQPWSPIDAIERAGVGERVEKPKPGLIALSQSWVDATTLDGDSLSGGHARIVWFVNEDEMIVLESTSRRAIGPRWTRASYADLLNRYPAGVRFASLN